MDVLDWTATSGGPLTEAELISWQAQLKEVSAALDRAYVEMRPVDTIRIYLNIRRTPVST